MTERESRLSDVERKLKDIEDKSKRNERIIKDNKDRIQELEKEVRAVDPQRSTRSFLIVSMAFQLDSKNLLNLTVHFQKPAEFKIHPKNCQLNSNTQKNQNKTLQDHQNWKEYKRNVCLTLCLN